MLSLIAAVAQAADPLSACCTAVGSRACPAEWPVTGPGTTHAADAGAVRATGLWKLGCYAGARFDEGATAAFPVQPPPGTVALYIDETATACFEAACSLPPDLCVSWDGDAPRVRSCRGAESPDAWTGTPVTDSTAVIIGHHVIRAVPTTPGPGGAAVAPPTGLDLNLPKAPVPSACRAPRDARDLSTAQVDAGDTAMLASKQGEGITRYRAAITLNPCNPFAWVGLGQAMLEVGAPVPASQALRVATALQPNHYTAWSDLGRAEEALGHRSEAAAAYREALVVKPDFGPAVEGYARTR